MCEIDRRARLGAILHPPCFAARRADRKWPRVREMRLQIISGCVMAYACDHERDYAEINYMS